MSQGSSVSPGQRVSTARAGLVSGYYGLHQRIAARAAAAPQAPALVCGSRCLTYEDLEVRTAALARRLRALGVGPESIVGVHLERSPEAVVALLAVLRAGGAYLPLDPSYPRERLSYMLADAGASALVTREGLRGSLPQEVPLVLCVDGVAGSGAPEPEEETGPEGLAYVLYTSGSSGRPKGVGISHGALAHHAEAVARAYGLGPRDRVLQFASLSFDVAAEEIYPSLLMGAAVVFVPEARGAHGPLGLVPEDLGAFAERERLTVLNLPSPYWHEWVDALERGGERLPSTLRLVVAGSEAVAPDKLAAWRRIVAAESERVAWINAYGLTESTITSTAFRLPHRRPDLDFSPVPVGRPLGEVRAHVLDASGQPAAPDTVGELWLGGPGIARGYLGRPDLTAERFVPDPFSSLPGARLLRTGDLARVGPDHNLRLVGRADAQLKVRGFRLEPEEIEAALRVHPAVRQAVVVARDERLTACVVTEGDAAPTSSMIYELRDLLRQTLPEHMVPGAFVFLDRLPTTANGKVDRRALTALASGATAGATAVSAGDEEYEAPRTPVEEALTGLWEALLGIERVGVHDDFFCLGGHSLLATRLVSRVRSLFDVEIDLCDVFEAPTPAGLAARVEGAWRGVEAPPLVPAPPAACRPLSHAQRRLWFLHRFQGESGAYNMPTLFRIHGELRRDALAAALNEVVRRHEALRTVFALVDGGPVQVVTPFAPTLLPVVDLSSLSGTACRAEAARLAAEDAQTPFDLGHGPLVRCTLLSLGDEEHALLVNSHHIVSDGWSVGVLVRELIALYQAAAAGTSSPLPELPIQYGDFAVWQHEALDGPAMETQLAYWRQRLAGLPPALELPTDRQRPPVQTFRGAVECLALPATLARDLERVGRDIGRGQGATLYMTLLAGFQALLSRFTGQDDLLVGSPIANRTRAEVEDLIGFFVNTLVLRTDLSGDPTFAELMGRVRANALGAYAHQDVPFERLVEELSPERDLSRTPLFQVVFGLHNSPMPRMELAPGLTLALEEPHTETAKFDLSLLLEEGDHGLVGTVEYSTDLFDATTIRRFVGCFQTLLTAAAADPAARLSDLPLLGEAERRQVLGEWNDTAVDFPRETPVTRWVEAQAAWAPEAVAVVGGATVLTYGELNRRANRLARHLQSLGAGPEQVVPILLGRSAELAVAALAVLKTGAAYLPIDPAYPADRVAFMVEDAGATVVLTRAALAASLPDRGEQALLVDLAGGEGTVWERATGSSDDLDVVITPESLAYVIYTSGSTGRPKGVAVQHTSLANLVHWHIRSYGVTAADRGCLTAGPAFDASVWELWPCLAAGARLLVPEEAVRLDAAKIVDWLRRERVSVCFLPTPIVEGILSLTDAALPDLRALLTGGDRLHRPSHSELPFSLINHYGPTESTVVATCGRVEAGIDPTIGRPIDNTRVCLLDAAGQPVPMGVAGELCIGGGGLARGYLGRPELTAAKFVPDPFSSKPGARLYRTGDLARLLPSGELAFLGRIDHQVKLRGLRIELGEIESALARHPLVEQAVVLVQSDRNGDQRLVAYVKVEEEPSAAELRQLLRGILPDYMVPAAFVPLEEFPLTPNGKVDRRALPELGAAADPPRGEVEFVAPRTPLEEAVAEIWREVLGVDRVGVRDRFWDLGGHSLLASKVLNRIEEIFGVDLPLQVLFEHPVIEDLTAAIGNALLAVSGEDAAHVLAELDGLTEEELELLLANPA